MQRLQDIAINIAPADGSQTNHSNAVPILHEIHHALQRFARDGEGATIDLRSIPFGPGDEDELLRLLGRGEISMELQSLGKSGIWETAYSGVWLIDHRNAEGERIALQVEVGRVPRIVLSPHEDISDAITRLGKQLNSESSA